MSDKVLSESVKEDIRELVIARLETLNPDSKILLMGQKEPISVRDMLKAVKDGSEFGEKIVEVQFAYIKMLASEEV